VSGSRLERFALIAVALATAIRLFAPLGAGASIAVIVLAIAALFLTRETAVRVGALVLLAVGAIDGTTSILATRVGTAFEARSTHHLDAEAGHLRNEIADTNKELDASAARIAARLAVKPEPSRGALFAMLHDEVRGKQGRGMRIVAEDGSLQAWWGEDLRVSGTATYLFDATSLYVTRTRTLPHLTVQAFRRIPNETPRHSLLNTDDDWIVSTIYHAGPLRQAPGARRYVIDRRPDSTLFVDIMPSPRNVMLQNTRDDGRDLSSLLIALGAIAVLAISRRRPLGAMLLLIAVARVAMLPFSVDEDPTHIFGFDVFA